MKAINKRDKQCKKKLYGATRYVGFENDVDGWMELRKYRDKIKLLVTTIPLSENKERMNFWDMIDLGDEPKKKYMEEDYTNQFYLIFTPKELLRLKSLIDNKIKQLKLVNNKNGK